MKPQAGSTTAAERPTSLSKAVGLADALDMPAELVPVQDAYWRARREWTELQHAYLTVIEDMLALNNGAEQPPAAERTESGIS